MNSKEKRVVMIILVLLIVLWIMFIIKVNNNKVTYKDNINVVPTMYDYVNDDSCYSPTLQLVWNDMKNIIIGKDIEFPYKNDTVDNLNKEYFTSDMISEEYYYKNFGLKTKMLKEEIEKGIYDKFKEKSDVLDNISWSDESNTTNYLFYSMLYREFKFKSKFSRLDSNIKFKDKKGYEFFGTKDNDSEEVLKQIEVLFYNSDEDYAVLLNTRDNDEVILYKNPKGDTFNDIYTNLINNRNSYMGNKIFSSEDKLAIPIIKFNVLKEYKELTNVRFKTINNDDVVIENAIQTINFLLDEEGGRVKSEGAIDTNIMSLGNSREFIFDDTFALFLKEKDKDTPYFALKVSDLSKYQ